MKARLSTDGGARGNPGPAAYGYVKLGPSAVDDMPSDLTSVEDMTPAQRAVLRARILRELQERDEERALADEGD